MGFMPLLGAGGAGSTAFSPDQISNLLAWYPMTSDYANVKQAAGFTSANSEYLSIVDNSSLAMGDIDMWVAGWFNLNTLLGDRYMFGTYDFGGNQRSWTISYTIATDRLRFLCSGDGTSGTAVNILADALGAPSTGVNYFILAWHDSVNNTLNIRINGGSVNSVAFTTGIHNSTSPLTVGCTLSSGTPTGLVDGTIDNLFLGKSPPGGIAAVISDIQTTLYNGGAGVGYDALSSTQKTDWGLVSCWELDEYSAGSGAVTRNDRHGTNHLTDNNTVPSATGLVTSSISDNDPVFQLTDRSGNGYTLSQSTNSLQPLWDTNDRTTLPAVKFDGVDDIMAAANSTVLDFERTNAFSISMWVYTSTNAHAVVAPIFTKMESSGNFRGWGIFIRGASAVAPVSAISFFLRSSLSNLIQVDTPASSLPAAGSYWHLVATYDGSSTAAGAKVYFNGVAQTMTLAANSLTITTLNTIITHLNGRNGAAVSASANRYGATLVYGKALSQAEVDLLYANT